MAKRKRTAVQSSAKRVYLVQGVVPRHELDEAIRVPTALVNEFGKQPAAPLNVAAALNLSPNSSHFRSLCGASVAYGFTDGGPFAEEIRLTELGRRAVDPTVEGDDVLARREALLRPQVIGAFLKRFDGSRLPRPDIAANILRDMNVPREYIQRVFGFVVDGAKAVGFLKTIKGNEYVDLAGTAIGKPDTQSNGENGFAERVEDLSPPSQLDCSMEMSAARNHVSIPREENRNVFITHGKNRAFIEPLKQLLTFGNFVPVVSVEEETAAIPLPEKVMNGMRRCGAAIIHVDAELKLMDDKGDRHEMLNSNVLIEIGAAMALYRRRFIILMKEGVSLPSNLQGLCVVKYEGDKLDGETTLKLLKAMNDIRSSDQRSDD
jgi:predicted nucleotide-binding protein